MDIKSSKAILTAILYPTLDHPTKNDQFSSFVKLASLKMWLKEIFNKFFILMKALMLKLVMFLMLKIVSNDRFYIAIEHHTSH